MERALRHRKSLLQYRAVRQAIEVVVAVGTVLLFSYLILQARW